MDPAVIDTLVYITDHLNPWIPERFKEEGISLV
jgi:hypothetical protein